MIRHMTGKDRGHIFFAFVPACVVGKKPEYPNKSSMADEAITRSGIVLGSPSISVVLTQNHSSCEPLDQSSQVSIDVLSCRSALTLGYSIGMCYP